MTEEFNVGDLVWAKMKGFPPWPGKVSKPTEQLKKPKGKQPMHCIFFFGSNNFAWIESHNVRPYEQHKEICGKAAKTVPFKEACAAIEEYKLKMASGEIEDDADIPEIVTLDDETEEDAVKNEVEKVDDAVDTDAAKPGISRRGRKKRTFEENGESLEKEVKAVLPKKRKASGSKATTDKAAAAAAASPAAPSGSNHVQRKSAVANFLDRPSATVSKVAEAPLNITHVSQTLKDKKITPSALKFGFLGLGTMGSGMVKNLLNSGHKVTVWNRTTEKCKDFLNAGAEQGMTPSDVIQTSDITFSCVADPVAAKEMVFGNCGVLQEITAAKSYVEMTGTDPETSIDIAEAVGSKGGRYLEAQIQGSKAEAAAGTLVILAAGDRDLYEDCQSAFQAMGKHSFFLGDVGSASKMNMVMQVMQGISVACLAEGMALADRAGLQQRDVMEILNLTSLACPLFLEKGNGIIDGGFPTSQPLQHMQKDLNLALGMGHLLEQPLPLAATANEIFKHAKRLGYGDHDVAAVYIRARF